jgi:beta-lactamase class A
MLTRRAALAAPAALALASMKAQADPTGQARSAIASLETKHGGRLGVVARDTGSKRRIRYRATERFPMCSTHKLISAAAILAMVDQGHLSLDQHVPYGAADLLAYAPVAKQNVAAGFMTVDALCAAAIEWSDNTAANLLLKLLGGPPGWTRYVRSIGDVTSRLDRTEPSLNTSIPGDPRDTSTPEAMVRDLNVILRGNALTEASRARLQGWLLDAKVTDSLIRAGLPAGWRVGDKSGNGDRGSRNDIGIILPPNAALILVAVFYTGSNKPLASRDQVIADVGRIVAKTFNT